MLIAKKLTKVYRGSRALTELDLNVGAGEVMCLLGPNGAGKTTTLSLFLGFIRPTSGLVLVGSQSVEADPVAARRSIAYVPEHVRLYPHLTGAENLRYFAHLAGVSLDRAEVAEWLQTAGLPTSAVDRPASDYSKGMRQKVVIALARARRASALLLDEPTSGLDPGAVRDLCHLIEQERERGAAVLMVTHDLGVVSKVATRIGVMYRGRLVHETTSAGFSETSLTALYRTLLERETAPFPGVISGVETA